MVKVRMNTADVAAEVKCLRRLIGMRCANVYDISPKAYLFKLMNSSGITESGESEKVLLLMESGIRLHTTQYVRDKNMTPSGFTLKIRKHIRTRRLEDVRQLGYDRIILFQFGLGSNAYFIILELYAQGNIILTDSEFTVMTLLRSHRDDDKGLAIMSRHRYPIEACRVFERTNLEKLRSRLTCWFEPASGSQVSEDVEGTITVDKPKELTGDKNMETPVTKGKNGNRSNKTTIKSVVAEMLSYGPALAEHIVMDAGLPPNMKVGIDSDGKLDEATIELLAQAAVRFEDWLQDVMSGMLIPEGYIFVQTKPNGKKESSIVSQESTFEKVVMYDEFCPLFLNQFRSREYIQFETFDGALDEFYSKIESQRAEQQQKTKEDTAIQKLDKIRLDQENRVGALKKEVDHSIKMAELIEYNLEDVDAAILAVRVALANGMDWKDLTRMVKEERKSGNPIASLIHQLHLERNCITLLLSNNLDEMDDDEKTSPVEKVEVDLALSAHANARRWYELKKKQESKQEKTIAAHRKAFKAAEKKTHFQLSQEKTVAAISHMRKVHWFEKFNWFISSENYLVISGRDAQQNEMIVKRYMSKGDLYVHAELHGASSTVIKNHKPDHAIPPLTLNQAGCFTVCQSQAWDSKIVTSAWWVYPHQVSKTAPTGEYLTVGSFMIRGKKNFLPPHPLVMGFGILFRLDESSLASHVNERRVRGEDEVSSQVGKELHNEESYSDFKEEIAYGEHTPKEADFPTALNTGSHKINSNSTAITTESMVSSAQAAIPGQEPKEDGVGGQYNLHSGEVNANENIEPSTSSQLEVLIDKALGLGPAKASSRSFGPDASVQQFEAQDNEDIVAMRREKPYMSKADRRKLKKGSKNTEISSGLEDKEGNKQDSLGSEINGSNKKLKKDNAKLVLRGQKGKLKKIKEKYSEQDDEERRIRITLLASVGKAQENEKEESQASVEIVHKSTQLPLGENESSKICYKCKKVGHLSRDCQQHTSEVDKSKDIRNKHDGDVHEETLDAESAINLDKIAKDEDDINEIAGEREKLNDLDMLTGVPLSSDILLYAVPVCGPYSAIQTYKYHVKITPGTARKGKAAKTAINLFSHLPEVTSREKELLKACTEPELVAAMIGNARITAPGLSQLKQKEKKGKKSSKEH